MPVNRPSSCLPLVMPKYWDPLCPEPNSTALYGPSHVCVAGSISNDWSVVQRLKRRNQVTLIEQPGDLMQSTVLATASVLALDCGDSPETGLVTLSLVSRLYPQLRVLLVNGTLSQGEIAEAFRRGACDYLPQQVNPELTAERIESLCRRPHLQEGSLTQ